MSTYDSKYDGMMYVFDERNREVWRGPKIGEIPSHVLGRVIRYEGMYDVIVVRFDGGATFKRRYGVRPEHVPMKVTPIVP